MQSLWPTNTLQALLQSPRVVAAALGDDLCIRAASPAFSRICVPANEQGLVGLHLTTALGIDAAVLRRPLAQLKARGEGFLSVRTVAGHHLGLALSAGDDGQIILHGGDLTREFELTEELRRRTSLDDLTGLLRRNSILDMVERGRVQVVPCGLVLVDLDHFKEVNDSSGHQAGDTLLRLVTARLLHVVGARQAVARIGGDEFAVYVPRPANTGALRSLGEGIVATLGNPFSVDGKKITIGCSAGAVLSDGTMTTSDLFADADAALYRAKKMGRNRFVLFDEGVAAQREEQTLLDNQLRAAIPGGEIRAATQGIFNLGDDSVHSFEALARWERPGHGLVPAAEFIERAADLGLSSQITESAFRRALSAVAEALNTPAGPSLAVNVDPSSLRDPHFTTRLFRIVNTSGAPADRITLEITEREPIPIAGPEVEHLRRLSDAGFGISIDDFGSGSSSLSYVTELPVNQIKVDRSLIARLGDDRRAEGVVASLIDLGARLDIEIVAEGIETEAQLAKLRALGCPLGQGYLLGVPQLAGPAPGVPVFDRVP